MRAEQTQPKYISWLFSNYFVQGPSKYWKETYKHTLKAAFIVSVLPLFIYLQSSNFLCQAKFCPTLGGSVHLRFLAEGDSALHQCSIVDSYTEYYYDWIMLH